MLPPVEIWLLVHRRYYGLEPGSPPVTVYSALIPFGGIIHNINDCGMDREEVVKKRTPARPDTKQGFLKRGYSYLAAISPGVQNHFLFKLNE